MKIEPARFTVRAACACAATLCAVSLSSPVARAAAPGDLDIQNFRPAMDSKGLVTLERSKALGTLEPSLGLYLNYAFDPLTQEIGGKSINVVENLGTANFVLALGFWNVVEVGANLPVVIMRGAGDGTGEPARLTADGFGDMQFSLKVKLLDRERAGVGVALVPSVTFDTGEENAFVSHGQGVYFTPRLAVDWMFGSRVYMALNGAARLRERRALDDASAPVVDAMGTALGRANPVVVGSDVQYGLGLGVILVPERLDLVLEGIGAAPLESDAARAMPLEALAALKIYIAGNSFLTLGGGRGLLGAAGDPDLRLFGGIVFEPAIRDRDGDGLNDDIDQCPDEPEDKDGYEDEDGCPDPDNDNDGLLDIVDQCPDIPEDKNGFEDEDGCPEGKRDRDGDGIIDLLDRCPLEPEDKDGFEDEDGCPDPDNDRDGLLDTVDQCPNDPEDLDGFEDDDGCPDPDNDKDGLLDNVDKCPNEPETFNGIEDEDGCPETGKRVVITRGKLQILDKVFFELNKAVIRPESYAILYEVAATLNANPQILKIEVQGHTDSRGADKYNLDLSDRRAAAVRTFLIDKGQVDGGRLTSKGYGETQPLEDREDEQAWSKNRRVEFIILEESGPTPTEFKRPD